MPRTGIVRQYDDINLSAARHRRVQVQVFRKRTHTQWLYACACNNERAAILTPQYVRPMLSNPPTNHPPPRTTIICRSTAARGDWAV